MRIWAAVALAVVVTACGSSRPQTAFSPTVTSATPSPVAIKPSLAGLLDRDGPPPAPYASVFGGFVVNVQWSDVQPTPGAEIPNGNPIDRAIDLLHQSDPSGRQGLKVRLFAGIHAPLWAKSLGGAPIPVIDPVTGASGTVGRFWSAEFGSAYDDLMSKLAAKYDSAPEVREVTISRCTTVYAEPFIRDAADADTVQNLLAAGYTVAADQQCHRDQIAAHQVWRHTRSDLSFNPYQLMGGQARTDETFTEQMMELCRSVLGSRCVLANNSLRVPLQFPVMYDRIMALGPPITFQTAVLAKVGDLRATLDTAIALGAGSVELPGGFQEVDPSQLADYNRRLAGQAIG